MFTNLFKKKSKLSFGQEAEDKAAKFLQKCGLKIVERNFHSRFGEIDIVAESENALHFIEVKASVKYDPLYRITPSKMKKIQKTIEFYMLRNDVKKDIQIDAIAVNNDIEWIQNIEIEIS